MKRTTYWVGTFRMPADNYEHEHVLRICSFGEDRGKAAKVLKANTSDDVTIGKLYPMEDHQQLVNETARVISEGGPSYRPAQGLEYRMTATQAYKARSEAGMSVSNIKLPEKANAAAETKAALLLNAEEALAK